MYNYQPTNHQPQYSQYPQYSAYPQNDDIWQIPMPPTARPTKARRGGKSGGGNGGRKRPGRRKNYRWALIKLLLLLLVLAGVGIGGYVLKVRSDVYPYQNVFLENISIDGINVSGMTLAEGYNAVKAQAEAKQSSWFVRLRSTSGEYSDITADMLGITFDPSDALEQAWEIGHDTSAVNRKTIFQLSEEIANMKTGSGREFTSVRRDTADAAAPIDEILQTLEERAYTAPQDAEILGFNKDDLQEPFTFKREQMGQFLDTMAIKAQILEMVQTFQSGEILLETTPIAPQKTVEELQKTVALRYRATTPIDRSSSEARTNNIRVAFSKINGLRIADGKSFSFNGVVGRRTTKNGFYEAIEIAYGEYVMGVGGGVCQASTTVYLAAIQSGMTIVKREAHSNPVSYTEPGKDATVSDTKGREIDLVFKNTSGGDVFITAHVISDSGKKNSLLCDVRIYGPSLGSTKYQLDAVEIEKLPKPTQDEAEIIQDTKAKYVTFIDEEKTVIEARAGCVVETYLRTFVDGVEVENKLVKKDTYPNRRAQIYVGVTPR